MKNECSKQKVTNAEIDEPYERSKRLVKWIRRFSIVYVLIYFAFFMPFAVDAPIVGNSNDVDNYFSKVWNSIQSLGSLGLNGLGDALAGLFAPLAFLWLAAAVYVQSNQLRSQQLELREQREEMNETQILMEKQIEATEAQTKILDAQYRDIKKKEVSELIKLKLTNIKYLVGKLDCLNVQVKIYPLRGKRPKRFLDKNIDGENIMQALDIAEANIKYKNYPRGYRPLYYHSEHIDFISIQNESLEYIFECFNTNIYQLKKILYENRKRLLAEIEYNKKAYGDVINLLKDIDLLSRSANADCFEYLTLFDLKGFSENIKAINAIIPTLKVCTKKD
ncbi:hypothetical protein [Bartonella sp. HY038]|uniref:hypothetical protein n=1 Tax=Bartonella sp. HY038 TaxID=2759660 RepID=UPI0015FA5A60|nr:hypothetical protein [Bartonella sp. HY038]